MVSTARTAPTYGGVVGVRPTRVALGHVADSHGNDAVPAWVDTLPAVPRTPVVLTLARVIRRQGLSVLTITAARPARPPS